MMTSKVTQFLEEKRVPFGTIVHPLSYTALDTAEAEYAHPHGFAKAVMVRIKGLDAMFVIPADTKLDLFKLSTEFGTENIRIEKEKDFDPLFADCERGAMPPLGVMYQIPTYVDMQLLENKEIIFNGGSHEQSIRMTLSDYLQVAEATIGDYCRPIPAQSKRKEK